jgi:hypothetical protein
MPDLNPIRLAVRRLFARWRRNLHNHDSPFGKRVLDWGDSDALGGTEFCLQDSNSPLNSIG